MTNKYRFIDIREIDAKEIIENIGTKLEIKIIINAK